MSKLADALRAKFKTPQAAIAALGLDSSILDDGERTMGMTSSAARAAVRELKRKRLLAMDANEEEAMSALQKGEEEEGDRARDLDPSAGVPPWLEEHRDDADDNFETEEERRVDEDAMRRAADLRRMLGHEASDDEWLKSEEELEFKPDTANATMDTLRMRRAADARKRLGRDETEEETKAREESEGAEDRKRARDRHRAAMDYRRATDRHHRATDALRRHADDTRRAMDAKGRADDAKKRADDAHRTAMDAKKAEDASRAAEDIKKAEDAMRRADDSMRRHADDARSAYDEVCGARDARRQARDRRRAADRKHAADMPSEFKGMPMPGGEMVSKKAMDAAIADALRENDGKHCSITAALEAVRPRVGAIAMDAAIQSEADVYGKALDILGVSHKDIKELPALKQMFVLASSRSAGDDRRGTIAMDSAGANQGDSAKEFSDWLPGAASIGRM